MDDRSFGLFSRRGNDHPNSLDSGTGKCDSHVRSARMGRTYSERSVVAYRRFRRRSGGTISDVEGWIHSWDGYSPIMTGL